MYEGCAALRAEVPPLPAMDRHVRPQLVGPREGPRALGAGEEPLLLPSGVDGGLVEPGGSSIQSGIEAL